jgi:hypothetical protein
VNCKHAVASTQARNKEKLAIESAYWRARGVSLELWTEALLSGGYVRNLRWLLPYREPESFRPQDPTRDWALSELHRLLLAPGESSLATRCRQFDVAWGWELGTALAGVRFALAQRRWTADLRELIDTQRPPGFLQ